MRLILKEISIILKKLLKHVNQGTRKEFELSDHHEDWEVFDLRIIHRKNRFPRNNQKLLLRIFNFQNSNVRWLTFFRTGFEENREFPVILNSVMAGRYCVIEQLGSATFSKVIHARDLMSGVDVSLKIIRNEKDFFDQSLDEIKLLKFVNKHDPTDEHHILRLYDYFYYQVSDSRIGSSQFPRICAFVVSISLHLDL